MRQDKVLQGLLLAVTAGIFLHVLGFSLILLVSVLGLIMLRLPYPRIVNSYFSRLIIGTLLMYSFWQLAALGQFFVAGQSDFVVLGVIMAALTVTAVGLTLGLQDDAPTLRLFTRTDGAAVVVASFFVVPLAVYCFWGNSPARLMTFGGVQSPDGSAHQVGIAEMYGAQHLTYRTNPTYYPKGFHIAQAVVVDAFGLKMGDNSWLTNARVFALQFLAKGFLLACTVYYLARQLLGLLARNIRPATEFLLALVLGPSLALFYLLPFAQEGFLNFYYICAAFIAGLLFMEGFGFRRRHDGWLAFAYCLFGLGVTMSWGPLVLPALAVIPVLYMTTTVRKVGDLKQFWRPTYLPLVAGGLLLAVPLYIHFSYSDETSFTAEGSIRIFNYGLMLAGVVLLALSQWSKRLSEDFRVWQSSVLWPALLLVGGLAAIQFLLVGEARYYTIKTAYLFEMIIVATLAVLAVWLTLEAKVQGWQRYILLPTVLGGLLFFGLSAAGNPLMPIKAMRNRPAHYQTDVQKVADLAARGELRGHNAAIFHYSESESKIIGNELILNWASALITRNEGNRFTAECNGKIYNLLTYGTGQADEQQQIIDAAKRCLDLHNAAGKPYYIITDPQSVPHIKRLIGDTAVFL